MADLEQDNRSSAQETLIREHLSARLEPQTGRAEQYFRQYLAQQPPEAEPRYSVFRIPPRFNSWTIGLVGAALAASLAALWAGPSLSRVAPQLQQQTETPRPTTPVNSVLIQQDVQSQTFDDGTYMTNDNTPMRVLRRRDLERTRVFDQNQHLQDEQVVPQDHVIYVPVKTY